MTKKTVADFSDKEIFEEAKARRENLRAELGPYATVKIMRECKGCGKTLSARAIRTHKCVISWRKR
jgi:hypothetical protein